MRNNKLLPIILIILTAITAGVLIASCKDFLKPQLAEKAPQTQTRTTLDRIDELALFHANKNFELSVEELQNEVQAVLQTNYETAVQRGEAVLSASSIAEVRNITVTVEDGFSSVTADKRTEGTVQETSEIPFYVFDLSNGAEQNGFALTCGDARIGSLIAVTEQGSFDDPDNPFLAVFYSALENYIYRTIEEYNSITDGDIAQAERRAGRRAGTARVLEDENLAPEGWYETDIFVEPLTIATQWNQNALGYLVYPPQWVSPYNQIINKMAGNSDENLWPSGCVATAIAQIMAYHEWPASPHHPIRKPSEKPKNNTPKHTYFVNPYDNNQYKWFDTVTYDWTAMKIDPDANNLANDAKMNIGVLMAAIGDKVSMEYGSDGSEASTNDVPDALNNMGYNKPTVEDYSYSKIKTSLDAGKPVYMSGFSIKSYFMGIPISGGGHAWVVDGYRTFTDSSNKTVDYVRCNAGWGGLSNGWYKSGVFNMTGEAPVIERSAARSVKEYYYQLRLKIIPGITPSRGLLFAGGSGAENNPFIIKTKQHLLNMANGDLTKHYKLANDITLENFLIPNLSTWTPIPEFRGGLDGDGHTISNMRIFSINGEPDFESKAYYGLIKENYGKIKNLKIEAGIIIGNIQVDEVYAGVFAGKNLGTIENCTSSNYQDGTMISILAGYDVYAGGMAGNNVTETPIGGTVIIGKILSCTNNSGIVVNAVNGVTNNIFGKNTGKISVDIPAIPGVPVPKAGFSSVANIDTNQYTGTVVWKNSAGITLGPGLPFAPQTQYTAAISLEAKSGFTFESNPANYFSVAGASASNAKGEEDSIYIDVTAAFPATGSLTTVNKPNIYLPAPAAGTEPEEIIYTNGQYKRTVLSWSPPVASGGTFAYNTAYTATIALTAEPGYTFQGVNANYFTIDTASVSNPPGGPASAQITVTAVFPAFSYFAGGIGSPTNPYLISSKQHFLNMELFPSQCYKLVDDIYLAYNGEYWEPMDAFYGLLDGDWHDVNYFRIEDEVYEEYTGIFRENHGTIKNMNVRGTLKVTGNGIKAGMLAGLNEGVIQNIETYSSSQGNMLESTYTSSHAGAIVGKNAASGEIYNCNNHGNFLCPFNRSGIASINEGNIVDSKNYGYIGPERFACGSGYATDPYMIETAGHFNSIRYVDSSSEPVYFKLANNVHLTDPYGKWNPIITFYGILNGAYYTVSFDLIEDSVPQMFTGLFRENHGYIINLNVAGRMILKDGNTSSGLICGLNEGTVWQCQSDYFFRDYYDYMIYNYSSSPSTYIGGIAGVNTGTINLVTNNGSIYSMGQKYQVVGLDVGTLTNWSGYGLLLP